MTFCMVSGRAFTKLGYQYTSLPMIVFSSLFLHSYVAHAQLTMHYL